jgi:hypothetical protein
MFNRDGASQDGDLSILVENANLNISMRNLAVDVAGMLAINNDTLNELTLGMLFNPETGTIDPEAAVKWQVHDADHLPFWVYSDRLLVIAAPLLRSSWPT